MGKDDAKNLLAKFQAGQCTEAEKTMIENWVMHGKITVKDLTPEELAEDLAEIGVQLPLYRRRKQGLSWKVYSAAAAVFIVALTGLYVFKSAEDVQKNTIAVTNPPKDQVIVPGSNKATITLSNGEVIDLTQVKQGGINTETGVKIVKTADNQLSYTIDDHAAVAKNQFNTVQTPRGGQFQVVLPDGTHVWLNAATSLKYPVSFAANERKVELSGEAYFEVAEDQSKPFRVITHAGNSKDQEVQVLGTHFNIQAYTDEQETKTTLLAGSVIVTNLNSKMAKKLSPGFQSVLHENNKPLLTKKIDQREVMAWKNGNFIFNDESLPVIMRQISRWYDVTIKYESTAANHKYFGGSISRSKNINQVLEILELTGAVHFKTVGRSVIVMN